MSDPFSFGGFLIAIVTAVLASLFLVYLAMRLSLSGGMLDHPGGRQSHSRPTPTGGGIGIVIALAMCSLWYSTVEPQVERWLSLVMPGTLLLSVVGWIDDRIHVSAVIRILVQLAVSLALLAFVANGDMPMGWPVILAGSLVMVGVMNAYNFMDGSHGMAGFQGLFSGLLLGFLFVSQDQDHLALAAFLLAGCCLGFLPMNFPRARVFMGDAGSVPLGYAFAGLMVLGIAQNALSLPVAGLVFSVFLVDSGLTLFKRVIRGERWYTAHKQHLYQRLIADGWPHSRVLLLYQAINMALVAPVAILAWMYPDDAWTLTGTTFLLMATGWYLASLRLGVRK